MNMRTRILVYSVIIVLVSAAITSVVSVNATINTFLDDKSDEMYRIGMLLGKDIAAEAASDRTSVFEELSSRYSEATGFRVTIIDGDGQVLADSQAGENYIFMENHGGRKEVVVAVAEGRGHARRDSESFGSEYIYEAVKQLLPNGNYLIVRLSMEIDKAKIMSQHITETAFISASIGIILGIVTALIYTRYLTRPIREMERKLKETLEKNKKAENIRKEFVANVTHELKTPLTSISGFAETLQGSAGENPEVRTRFLDIISLESARLSRLIDDTLIIQDIESGKEAMLTEGVIDLSQAIEDVIETLRTLADSKSTELIFEAQSNIYISGEEGRFKQLMVNLVENAIKYSDEGQDVYIKVAKKDDGFIYVSVQDKGIGISEEDIPRIFERFYRVDKSHSRDAGGTGLGLAIVKHIASLFDADLFVESEPGAGSMFTIRFPAD